MLKAVLVFLCQRSKAAIEFPFLAHERKTRPKWPALYHAYASGILAAGCPIYLVGPFNFSF